MNGRYRLIVLKGIGWVALLLGSAAVGWYAHWPLNAA
jgi:hypothetical protein